MDIVTWISNKVFERFTTIIGTSIIAGAERAALHSHLDAMEKTEEKAKELEASGNPKLAEYLRSRSEGLSLDGAGCQAQAQVANLSQPLGLPFEDGEPPRISSSVKSEIANGSAKKKRGRPKKSVSSEQDAPVSPQQELK